MPYSRDSMLAIAGCALIAAFLLLYAILGLPAYGFYQPMKCAVFTACAVSAFALFRLSARWVPVSFALAISGIVELLGKFTRTEWRPYNEMTIGLLLLSVAILGWRAVKNE